MIRMGAGMRRHRRFVVDLQTEAAGTWLRDISKRGMKVLSKHVLHIEEAVETGLETPHGTLHLKGRVVRACRSGIRSMPFEYGIELEAMAAADDLLLQRYLDDLSEEAAVAPETPVDPLDLQRLQDRIEELEKDLEKLATAPKTDPCSAGETVPSSSPLQPNEGDRSNAAVEGLAVGTPDNDRLATDFDWPRFSHLVRIGQPLLADPTLGSTLVEGELAQMVASRASGRFDIHTMQENIGAFIDEERLVVELFELYRRDLIDFA